MDNDHFKLKEEDLGKVSGDRDLTDEEMTELYEAYKGNRYVGYKVCCSNCGYVFASANRRYEAELLLTYAKSHIGQCPNCQAANQLMGVSGIKELNFIIK